MFSIGEFSRLCMVTPKTLRHYDAIGLLKPVSYNEETGYRYYDVSQLSEMMFIIKMKAYGFSLDEISGLLKADRAGLLPMLKRKLAENSLKRTALKKTAEQLKSDIMLLEKGANIMEKNIEIQIVERPETAIISEWGTLPIKEIDKLFSKVYEKAGKAGVRPADAPITIYHSKVFDPDSTEMEVAVPIAEADKATRMLAGGKFAMAVHIGPYSQLNQTYTDIAKWIEENGHIMSGAPFEIYYNNPQDTPVEDLKTEVFFPIK